LAQVIVSLIVLWSYALFKACIHVYLGVCWAWCVCMCVCIDCRKKQLWASNWWMHSFVLLLISEERDLWTFLTHSRLFDCLHLSWLCANHSAQIGILFYNLIFNASL
jgi:hypothetical protein